MFRDKRQFRAIFAVGPQLTDIAALTAIFPSKTFEEATEVPSQTNTRVMHMYYMSETPFFDTELLADISVQRGRKTLYRYDVYAIEMRIKRRVLVGLAAPFARLATELFTKFDSLTANQGRNYIIAKLP